MSDRMNVSGPLVSTSTVAEYMGCSPETVRRMFDTDRQFDDAPRPVKLSTGTRARLRWRMEDIVRWVEEQVAPEHRLDEATSKHSPRPSRTRYADQTW